MHTLSNGFKSVCVQLQFHFPPVHIVLPRNAIIVMALTIDEALPQALLPRVDGQVVEAKQGALILTCMYLIIEVKAT